MSGVRRIVNKNGSKKAQDDINKQVAKRKNLSSQLEVLKVIRRQSLWIFIGTFGSMYFKYKRIPYEFNIN